MRNFYKITKKEKKDGNYHLHSLGCKKTLKNQKKYYSMPDLFNNSLEALAAARKIHPNIKPCKLCCPSCFNQENPQ
jgi:hypothetical protein